MKRKADDEESESQKSEAESGAEEEEEIIDIDFDFFDPREIDFHGLKSLLRQTFSQDAEQFDLSAIADAIIAQPHIGSIVKVDDSTDPYAVMTVLGLKLEIAAPMFKMLTDELTWATEEVSQE
ncbi:Mss4p nuclear export [Phlyctochytrium bullatum]|nr:Mss4p nuclear export [Phlyctochytrium bullatum]